MRAVGVLGVLHSSEEAYGRLCSMSAPRGQESMGDICSMW